MKITLVRTEAPAPTRNQHAWLLRVTATSDAPAELGSEVFVYHAARLSAASDDDVFSAIASLVQMATLPVGAPVVAAGDEEAVPYYRKNICEIYLPTAAEVERIWLAVQADVRDLVNNYKATQVTEGTETVEIE